MAANEPRWTPAQHNAIYARGGSVLVSAAAGSGKTAVLVERVAQRLLDPEHPVDADRLLVVTFSNAAAAEMKERIALKLAALLEQRPNDRLLQRQQLLLGRAQISTIHAFCLELLRRNFQTLGLSPGFRIADEKELALLRDSAAQAVIERFYREEGARFSQLVELLSNGRDDRAVTATLLRLYDFIRSHPFYLDWLDEKLSFYDPQRPVGETVWGRLILSYARDTLAYARRRLREALDLIEEDEKMQKAYAPIYYEDLDRVEQLLERVQEGAWDACCRLLERFEFGRLGVLRGYEDTLRKQEVQQARSEVKEIIDGLRRRQFCTDSAAFAGDISDLREKVEVLFALTRAFDSELQARKQERGMVDFADLEQLSLRLLVRRGADGTVERTPLALELSGRYEEIFIDEYQDTNQAQDLIFTALSQEENNLFLVGDVKQSIYRFRQAMPGIFLKKRNAWPLYDGVRSPSRIILGHNFRSRPEVTGAVNYFFRLLMSEQVGEIRYDSEEELVAAANYPPLPGCGAQLHLLDVSQSADAPALCEARYVAAQIAGMLQRGVPVTGKDGKLRLVRAGDICILMRSPSGRAELYARELAAAGVASWSDSHNRYLESTEISSVLSLLRAVDNPLVDIPLVSAMMSPIFAFTADEIAAIRLCDRKAPFYLALCRRAETDAHAAGFLSMLSRLREGAATLPADRLLRHLLDLTGFESMVLAMERGEERRANLRLLIGYAADYDRAGYCGLSGFLRFLDAVAQRGDDLPAAALSGTQDAVRIMSIHRSKGLEFPVVFLCDTARQFNREELRSNTLLHAGLGFACVRRDFERQCQFTTVALEAMRLETERMMLSEELRILYVALTRARERLILVSSQKNPAGRLAALRSEADQQGRLPSYQVRRALSYSDWLMMAALLHPQSGALREMILFEGQPVAEQSPLALVLAEPCEPPCPEESPELQRREADPALLRKIALRAQARYPDEVSARTPSKLAVTAIVQEGGEEARGAFESRPNFLFGHGGLTAAERGSAVHQYMLFADHAAARRDFSRELQRLVTERFLTEAQAACIRPAQLAAYYNSALARRVEASKKVWRELRFMTELGREELSDILPELGERTVTVQGVADLVFCEGEGVVIVDYKTDQVDSMETLRERYARQLALYARVLPGTLGLPVVGRLIYSITLGKEIEV